LNNNSTEIQAEFIKYINPNIKDSEASSYIFHVLFLNYAKQQKFIFIFLLIIIITIWASKIYIFDNAITELTMNVTKGTQPVVILYIIGIIIAIKFLLDFFQYISEYITSNIVPNYNTYLRTLIIEKIYYKFNDNFNLSISYTTFLQILFDLCYHLRHVLLYFLNDFLVIVIAVIIKLSYMYNIHIKLFYITLISIFISLFIIYYYSKEIIEASSIRSKITNNINKNIYNNFENLLNIYVNNKINDEMKYTRILENKFNNAYQHQLHSIDNFSNVVNVFFTIVYSILIMTSFYLYKNKQITSEQFVNIIIILNTYIIFFSENINSIPHVFLTPIGTLFNFYDTLVFLFEDDILQYTTQQNNNNNLIKNIDNWNITIDKLSFRYNIDTKYIFDNFSYQINEKDIVLIKGQSGIGKSTFAKILVRLFNNYTGKIYIDNHDLQNIDIEYIRNNITYVSQNNILYDLSVIDNIQYGNNKTSNEIIKYLQDTQLDILFDKLPDKLHTEFSSSNPKFSYGMQKIILLLRGIFRKSKIIIFDEPLNGLDPITKAKIIKIINELSKNKTVIIITHNNEFDNTNHKLISLK